MQIWIEFRRRTGHEFTRSFFPTTFPRSYENYPIFSQKKFNKLPLQRGEINFKKKSFCSHSIEEMNKRETF